MSHPITVYTADGRPVTVYAEPQHVAAYQPAMPINAMPTPNEIMALAQPGERITVSMTVERTSTAPTLNANVIADEYGQVYVHDGKMILKVIILIAGLMLFIKAIEVIAEHPIEFMVGIVALGCAIGAISLVRGGKTQ